jgi:arsenate reductase (thioredoxin)
MIMLLILASTAIHARAPRNAAAVVFVCEHGNVKSLIAKEWFDRMAAARGLAVRAVSRGLTPGTSVPPAIADALRRDGFDVRSFVPHAFGPADTTQAQRIVLIGVDASAATPASNVPTDRWDGIPPATEGYEASRDALRSRIESLLSAVEAARPRP